MNPTQAAPAPPGMYRRRHSIAGPIILIVIGLAFLFRNFVPDIQLWPFVRDFWPVLLIVLGLIRAVEVIWAFYRTGDAHAYRSMGFGQVVLLVLVCFGIAAATRPGNLQFMHFHGGGVDLFGEQFDYPVSMAQPAVGAKRLVLENLRGNITVSGGDGTEIRVEGRKTVRAYNKQAADSASERAPLRLVQQGDQLVLRAEAGRGPDDVRISTDLDISVPRQISIDAHGRSGDLSITTISGDVTVTGQRGEVRLTGVDGGAHIDLVHSGLVRAADVKGDLQLEGRGSDIQLENIGGQVTINGSYSGTLEFRNLAKPLHFESEHTDLRVAQIPGNITMDLSDFRANNVVGPIRLSARSRDIHVDDFTDSLTIELERGDIELKPGKAPAPKMEVHARSGNIQLDLPPNAEFNLKATSRQGEVRNDYGDAVETEGEGRSATLRSVKPAGSQITLSTDQGTVSVGKT